MDEGTDWNAVLSEQREVGAQLAGGVEVKANPLDPRKGFFVVRKNGADTEVDYKFPERTRKYRALSLAALCSIVGGFSASKNPPEPAERLAEQPDAPKVSNPQASVAAASARKFIFVAEDGVTALLDEAEGNETVRFDLQKSDAMMAIESLKSAQPFTQKGLIDFLRRSVAGSYTPDDIIERIRQVKFAKSTGGEASVQNGKESLSRSMVAELQGFSTIPDLLDVTIPYFDNAFGLDGSLIDVEIALCLDIDVEQERFSLRPRAGELARAREHALGQVDTVVAAYVLPHENVSVFQGTPA